MDVNKISPYDIPNIFIQLTSPLGNPQLGQVPLSRAATRAAGPGRRRARLQRMMGETYSDRRCGDLEWNLGKKMEPHQQILLICLKTVDSKR